MWTRPNAKPLFIFKNKIVFLKQVYFKNYPYFSNQGFFNFQTLWLTVSWKKNFI